MLGGSSHDQRLDVFIASLYMLVHVVWIRFALRGDATSILHVVCYNLLHYSDCFGIVYTSHISV